jgi:hypothetical protein
MAESSRDTLRFIGRFLRQMRAFDERDPAPAVCYRKSPAKRTKFFDSSKAMEDARRTIEKASKELESLFQEPTAR